MKQKITEKDNIHKGWYELAERQTLETLPEFLYYVTEEFEHDYGTICHAITASAIATAYAVNSHPQGGITGFQAGAVMWEFIRNWNYKSNKTGLRIVDYDNLLYPQYEDKFENTITQHQWSKLQEEAKLKLQDSPDAAERVLRHWQSIVAGNVPFGFKIKEN